jgi:enoyl-CoA hydratase/carnithine racemase
MDVSFGREDQVEVITLCRPDVLNAFNFDMLRKLTERFEDLGQ